MSFERAPRSWAARLRFLPPLLRSAAIVCLAVAMARPQSVGGQTRIAGRGVAIVAAVDLSSSMTEADFAIPRGEPIQRLDAARRTFTRFVQGRPDDLIGLVGFANYADLACPPTLDHPFLTEAVAQLDPARPGDDGTNLGEAIAVGLDALRKTSPKQKVLILLSDGLNEPAVADPIDPTEMALLASEMGIVLHTIAIGLSVSPGSNGRTGRDLLAGLARVGGGRAFVAEDAEALGETFRAIDALSKSRVSGTFLMRYRERYAPWVLAALGLVALDILLSSGRFRRLA